MDKTPVPVESPKEYRRRLWGLSRDQADRAGRDGTGWIVGVLGSMIGVPSSVWAIAAYGPIGGGVLALLISFVAVFLVFLVIRRLDAPKVDLERRLKERDEALMGLQAKLNAIATPSLYVETNHGFSQDPFVSTGTRIYIIDVFFQEDRLSAVSHTSSAAVGKPVRIPGERTGVFSKVRVINEGSATLTNAKLTITFILSRWASDGQIPEATETVPISRLGVGDTGAYEFFVANHTGYGVSMKIVSEARATMHDSEVSARVVVPSTPTGTFIVIPSDAVHPVDL